MTLPAAGTGICGQIWANPQGVWFELAEMQCEMFLRTAGRVMTLPYGLAEKSKLSKQGYVP